MDQEKLENELESIVDSRDICAIETKTEDYQEASRQVLKYFTEEGFYGIYLTVNKTYPTINRSLKNEDVNTEKIFFIDAISREMHAEESDEENVIFLDSPENLTDISIVCSEVIESMPGNDRFLFIDSLSALSIYNNSKAVSNFSHHLLTTMRESDISGAIIMIEKELDDEISSNITQFADKTITI